MNLREKTSVTNARYEPARSRFSRCALAVLVTCLLSQPAHAHGVPLSDKALITGGWQIAVFVYLGAKSSCISAPSTW
jgi:hypothetical protein